MSNENDPKDSEPVVNENTDNVNEGAEEPALSPDERRYLFRIRYNDSWSRNPRRSLKVSEFDGDRVVTTVSCGSQISKAAAEAIDLRAMLVNMDLCSDACTVEFRFNDTLLVAREGSTAGDLEADYDRQLEEAHKAYWTPARLAEKETKERTDIELLNLHLQGLDVIDLTDLRAALRWLCVLETLAKIHTPVPKQVILDKFKAAGLEPGVNIRPKDESVEDWQARMGEEGQLRWVIGQGLDGVAFVGSPHGVIHSFAKDFGVEV